MQAINLKSIDKSFNFTSTKNNNTKTSDSDKPSKINIGKYFGLGIGVGSIIEKVSTKGGISGFVNDYHDDFAKSLEKELSKTATNNIEIKGLSSPLFKRMANVNAISSVGLLLGSYLAIGAVVDWFINMAKSVAQKTN